MGKRTRGTVTLLLQVSTGGFVALIAAAWLTDLSMADSGVTTVLNFLLGVLTAVVVGLILNSQVSNDLATKFQIISHSEHAGLLNVHKDRASALREISNAAQSKRDEDIDILTIAGKNFFQSGSDLFRSLFEAPLSRSAPHRYRILLLHPNSNAALERSHRELPNEDRERLDEFIREHGQTATAKEIYDIAPYLHRSNCRDVIHSIEDLTKVLRTYTTRKVGIAKARLPHGEYDPEKTISRIQVRLHFSTPALQLTRVDDRLFVEQYHLGKNETYAIESLDNCLARKVPVMEYFRAHPPGQLLTDHFEYLWGRSEIVLDENNLRPDIEALRARFGDPERYVSTLAALHIYGNVLNRFLEAPAPRAVGDQAVLQS